MSDKLIAVEYCPIKVAQNITILNSHAEHGTFGETLLSEIKRARNKRTNNNNLYVRFPLTSRNYRASSFADKPELLSKRRLKTEGIAVAVSDIFPLKRLPVSSYKAVKLPNKGLEVLPPKGTYYQTRSATSIVKAITAKEVEFPCGWDWSGSISWTRRFPKYLAGSVLLEANVYPLETLLPLADPTVLKGFVLELVTRVPGNACPDSVVLVCTNVKDYVTFVDGVEVEVVALNSWGSYIQSLCGRLLGGAQGRKVLFNSKKAGVKQNVLHPRPKGRGFTARSG